MSTQKYEIEHVTVKQAGGCGRLAQLSMLTGLPVEELRARVEGRLLRADGWYGRDFVSTFQRLGYNCSPRFVKFDPDTQYPCLLRYGPSARGLVWARKRKRRETGDPTAQLTEREKHWWSVVVYYDGLVYEPHYEGPWLFHTMGNDVRVTSMLQVWLSDL